WRLSGCTGRYRQLPRPPRAPLFPYTTLFRSSPIARIAAATECDENLTSIFGRSRALPLRRWGPCRPRPSSLSCRTAMTAGAGRRSEEHTSELQSRENLVCRLLLEKENIGRQA